MGLFAMIDTNDVSVVVPLYNPGRFLEESLNSVLHERPGEIVLVDDASTAPWPELPETDIPFRVVRHEVNRGPGAARNTGVAAARGSWIAYVDADDLWQSGRLALQLSLAEQLGCDFVFGRTAWMAEDGGPDPGGREPRFLPHMGSMLVRKTIALNFAQDETWNFGEDLDFYMQVKERGVSLHRHDDIVLHYRRHSGGMTSGRELEKKKGDLMRVLRRSLVRRREQSSAIS